MFSQIEILRLVKSPDGQGDITREYEHLTFAQGAVEVHQNITKMALRSSVDIKRGDVAVIDEERYVLNERLSNSRARYVLWTTERGME